ncbi:hypothetical protein JCM11251_005063 [Rhodosporidiobolus azoricus]
MKDVTHEGSASLGPRLIRGGRIPNTELAAATPLVNEERNPRPPTLYMSCTVSAKDAQVALANEERNPRPPTLYMSCTIA